MDDKAGKAGKAQIASATELQGQQGPGSSKALTVAEYGMLGTSAVGTVAAVLTKQVAYAAAPLSVSLFLNLLQRQQLNRRLELQNQQSIQQAQSIEQAQLAEAQLQENVQTVQGGLETVDQRLARQEKLERDRPDFASQITQLEQTTAGQLQDVQTSLKGAASQNLLAQLQAEFAEQKQQQQYLAEDVTATQSQLQGYIQDHEATHQALDAQTQALDAQTQELKAQTLSQAETLEQRLAWFEDQLQAFRQPAPAAPEIKPVIETVVEPPVADEQGADPPAGVAPPAVSPPPDKGPVPAEVATLFLNLGIDFGTRFTKVCFQNLSDEQSEIIPFQGESSTLSDALLLSQIGILPNGQLLAGLNEQQWQEVDQPGLMLLDGLKMRLADLELGKASSGWRLEAFPELEQPEMVENLCAYYLSRVIQKSQLWIREHQPRLVANETIEWSANVGVPVAYCDERPVSDRFQRVLSLAWLLSNQAQTQALTLQLLQEQMQKLRQQLAGTVNCHAVPEIAAESWSFLNSRQAREGYYLFFDIGDGTIDGCVFNYERVEGEPQVEFYHGQVQPLGVRSLSQGLVEELQRSPKQIATALKRRSPDEQLTQSEKCKEVLQMMAQVVVQGGNAYAIHHPSEKDETYQKKLTVFLGGGGSKLPFFKHLPEQTYQTFSHRNLGIRGYDVKPLPVPRRLQLNGLKKSDFHRFAVAFGLATDHANLAPAIHLPGEMAAQQPQQYASQSVGGDVISYEDSKDAY